MLQRSSEMLMMPSLLGWTVLCLLLLWKRTAALGEEVRCSLAPAGQLHPVRGLLERFQTGPGCVARERGDKETHVIAVGSGTHYPGNKSFNSVPVCATDAAAVMMNPVVERPSWAEERRLRLWLNSGGRARGGRESFTVQCEDGCLSVSVDRRVLQSSSVPVTAVTLRDSMCQAQSNGSHFLLVFPLISCGTENLLLGQPRGVQYQNTVLLWRDAPQAILALNETERKSKGPLGIHFSCFAAVPTLPGSADVGPVSWALERPGSNPGLRHLPTLGQTSAAVLVLKLSAAERYKRSRIGPCVITADHRVYVEISAKGPFIDMVEVKSCVVSPLSDPKQSRFWTVLSEGCSSDPSLTLSAKTKEEEVEGAGGDDKVEEEKTKEETDGLDRRGREAPERLDNKSANVGAEEEIRPLRFSFILRPVYNDSIQFLHCSLRLCISDLKKEEPTEEKVKTDCQDRLRIPPLVSRSSRHQCEVRNLYRPMVVTHPISSLAPTADQRTKRLSLPPLASPDPEHSMPTGPLMGIVFAAFVMAGCLMGGGLWGIYYCTGALPTSLGGENHVTDHPREGPNSWNPTPPSDQSSSSV
ncbi:transforming growth factor beta receptor type 3 [Cyclopterus lumpus]|uniref:transforming growth factor beta receptor type 3 n=1 Tax=Cyclopterus lumpus TaxID=8103 RepID=UPI00148627B6|nr:transforming growth factor beta receptor type 3 [Cyclopterus lumpus]